MPIGSSKAGVLGAGVVPGGSETFNSSGTFSVPVGVTCVSVTGLGGTGNAGNAGQPGGAGGGGSGGGAKCVQNQNTSPIVVNPSFFYRA